MKRKSYLSVVSIVAVIILGISQPVLADKFTDTIDIYKKSDAAKPFFESAYGYAVFPTIGKVGLGVGAAFGKGQVYQGGKVTGEVQLVKFSLGLQAGGQAFSELIFFEDKRAYDDFTSGEFEMDASASAVAITAGVQAKAGTQGASAGVSAGPATAKQAPAAYRKGLVVFVHIKGGLMYEAAIGGQKFVFTPKDK